MNRWSPTAAEPVTQLRRIPIVESGEALVDFMAHCSALRFDKPIFNYRRERLVRATVAEKLCEATRYLPDGVFLAVLEGWRAPLIQERMYRAVWKQMKRKNPHLTESGLRRLVNRYSAPMDKRVPPPHTTGGAVDVALVDAAGDRLDAFSPYENYDPRAFAFSAPGLSDTARKTRDTLAEAFVRVGLTNYPSETWHWSYGDQGWAYRGGHDHALYGPITPDGWLPAPEDVSDEALRFVRPEEHGDAT